MGNVKATTKFSRLMSISSIEDYNYSILLVYSNLFVFKGLFTMTEENYHVKKIYVKKMFIEIGYKEV